MSNREREMRDMEALVAAMLTPLANQPMRLFIRAFTGCAVRPAPRKAKWLAPLRRALDAAGRAINEEGLFSRRANEVGNKIEPFVREALTAQGFRAGIPSRRDGRRQSAGYPDIEVTGLRGREEPCFYLECKTYNPDNAETTLRSFYLSPPLAKVTRDAMHLLVAYRMEACEEHERRDGLNRYRAREWRLLDLHDLRVDVKHEIQASNRALYGTLEPVLTGRIP